MDKCPNQYYSHEQRTPYQPWAPEHCYDQQGYGQNQQFYNFDQQHGPSMECGMREDFQQYDMNHIGQNSGGNWNQNQQSNWNNNQNSGCNWSQTTQHGQGWGQGQNNQNWHQNQNQGSYQNKQNWSQDQGQGNNQYQGSYDRPWNQYTGADQSQSYGYSDGNGYGQNENYLQGQDVNPGYGFEQHQQVPQQNQYHQLDQNLMNLVAQFMAETNQEKQKELLNQCDPQLLQQLQQMLHVSRSQVVQSVNESPAWKETCAPPEVNQSQYDHCPSQPQAEPEALEIDLTYAEEERECKIIEELSERVSMVKVKKGLTHQINDWHLQMRALLSEVRDALGRVGTITERIARGEYRTSTTLEEWLQRGTRLVEMSKDLISFVEARRLEKEEESCVQEVLQAEDEDVSAQVHVGSETEESVCHDEVPDLEVEAGSHTSPTLPIAIFDYGRFHVLPSEPPTIELKNDDTLVEFVMPPTIYRSEQDCFGDDTDSLWDEDELKELDMEDVQLVSTIPPPDEIQIDDLEGCIIDLGTFFEETETEEKDIDMGSPISSPLPIGEIHKECMEEPDESDEPLVVDSPGEVQSVEIPVPDYYSFPLCVDEFYAIDFVESPVEEARRGDREKRPRWCGDFKKKMIRKADKRRFSGWEVLATRAQMGKFLMNSISVVLALFGYRKLLVFLSSDFG